MQPHQPQQYSILNSSQKRNYLKSPPLALTLLCISVAFSFSIESARCETINDGQLDQENQSKNETRAASKISKAESAIAAKLARPIPEPEDNGTALSYHELAIDFKDKRNKEKLVDLADFGIAGEAFYARKDRLNAPYYQCVCGGNSAQRLRESVAKKLCAANKQLEKYGIELYVFDAYRPVLCQKNLWRYFKEEAQRITGSTDQTEIESYAGKFCSNPTAYDPTNYKTWPTHLTGGAVDLTLRRIKNGELLHMGGIFDDASEQSFTRHFESIATEKLANSDANKPPQMTPSASAMEARRNRRMLYWAMTEQGFANYPNEWWHFDYGNQMWVQNSAKVPKIQAFYGAI